MGNKVNSNQIRLYKIIKYLKTSGFVNTILRKVINQRVRLIDTSLKKVFFGSNIFCNDIKYYVNNDFFINETPLLIIDISLIHLFSKRINNTKRRMLFRKKHFFLKKNKNVKLKKKTRTLKYKTKYKNKIKHKVICKHLFRLKLIKLILKNLLKFHNVKTIVRFRKFNPSLESISSWFLVHEIAKKIKRRIPIKRFFNWLYGKLDLNPFLAGFRVEVKGRLFGYEKASSIKNVFGQTSLQRFSNNVDFSSFALNTKDGVIGIKVWLTKKKIYI